MNNLHNLGNEVVRLRQEIEKLPHAPYIIKTFQDILELVNQVRLNAQTLQGESQGWKKIIVPEEDVAWIIKAIECKYKSIKE